MRVIDFPQSNRIWYAPPSMENCDDLPCYQNDEFIISCFKMTWKERINALLFGRIWHWHYASRPAPVALAAAKTVFEKDAK